MTIRSLSPEFADDWMRLFEGGAFRDNPDWSSCYCLEPYMERAENDALTDRAERRRAASDLIASGVMRGLLAYEGEKAIGWCNCGDRRAYPYLRELYRECAGETELEDGVFSIVCLLVRPDYRGRGVAGALVEHACQVARNAGFDWVEGYPFVGVERHFHGSPSMYERYGFETAADFGFLRVTRRRP